MKNVVKLPPRHIMRVPIPGAPPLKGWTLKYVSGLEQAHAKPGDLLSMWQYEGEKLTFAFEPQLNMVFSDETGAKSASDLLRDGMEIKTEVIKVE